MTQNVEENLSFVVLRMNNDIDPWNEKDVDLKNGVEIDPLGDLPPIQGEPNNSWSNLYEEEDTAPLSSNLLSVTASNFGNVQKYVNERLRILDVSHKPLKLNPDDRESQHILQCLLDLIRIKELDVDKMEGLGTRIGKLQCDKENIKVRLLRRKERIQALTIESKRRKLLIRRTEKKAQEKYAVLEKEMKALELQNRKHNQKNNLLDKKIFKLEKSQQDAKERMLKIVNNDRTNPLDLLKKKKTKIRRRKRGENVMNSRSMFVGYGGSSNDFAFGPPMNRSMINETPILRRKKNRKRNNGNDTTERPSTGDHRKVETVNTRLWKHGLARNVNNLYRNIVGAYEDQRHELVRENEELKGTLRSFFKELGVLRNIFYSKKGQRVFHTEIEDVPDGVIDMPFDYSSTSLRELGFRKLKELKDLLTNEGYKFDHGVGEEDEDFLSSGGPTPAQTPSQKLFGSARTGKARARRTATSTGNGKMRPRRSPSISPTVVNPTVAEISDDLEESPPVVMHKKIRRSQSKSQHPPGHSKELMCKLLNISFPSPSELEDDNVVPGSHQHKKQAMQKLSKMNSEHPPTEIYVRELIDLIESKIPEEEDRKEGMRLLGEIYRRLIYYTNLMYEQFWLLRLDMKRFSVEFQGFDEQQRLIDERLSELQEKEKLHDSRLEEMLNDDLDFKKSDLEESLGRIIDRSRNLIGDHDDDGEDRGGSLYLGVDDENDSEELAKTVDKIGSYEKE